MAVSTDIRQALFKLYARSMKLVFNYLPYKPPELVEGENSFGQLVAKLKSLGCSRTVLVTDSVLESLQLHSPLVEALKAANNDVVIFSQVPPDPPFHIIESGVEVCLKHQFDSVIALGGGSVMDAAKVINVCATHGLQPRKVAGLFKIRKRGKPIACIPTTAGTGSEVTIAAVVSDPEKEAKYPVVDLAIVPDFAVLEGELTRGLPAPITAATGADALTHALEAMCSRYAREDTDAIAVDAIKMIFVALPRVATNGDDIEARRMMLKASYLAGIAFTQANVGWVHAIAHQLGGIYHTPHGLANGIVLPKVLAFYQADIPHVLANIARATALVDKPGTDQHDAAQLVEKVGALLKTCSIPDVLDDLLPEDIPRIAERAISETYKTPYGVPQYFESQGELEAFLKQFLKAS